MHTWSISFAIIPVSFFTLIAARLHHSLVPEDPYAFPKYRVTFLNGLPVLNETAERWLQTGLRGGELEFLNQPWEAEERSWRTPPVKSIEGVEDQTATGPVPPQTSSYTLELMKMGPKTSYLCLIPPRPEESATSQPEEPSSDITPVHTWSLLQPLAGTCLYHRQGWFTYAYCHNSHVRQFHELTQGAQSQRPGEYRPEEDTEWEAYTLGRAPPTMEPGADLTTAEEAALAANVELARGAGSRYLVQRWGDGTYCDKTGRKREIEIQFHCSMTMTDTILFVKETSTCHYILHIATPRLCGEPGFRSPLDVREEAFIRCREIMSTEAYEATDKSLPEADLPIKMPKRSKPVIAPPPERKADDKDDESVDAQGTARQQAAKGHSDLIRKALERLIAGGELKAGEVIVENLGDGDEEVVIEFIDYPMDTEEMDGEGAEGRPLGGASLEEVLRAAGYEIKGERPVHKKNLGKTKSEVRGQQRRPKQDEKEQDEEEEGGEDTVVHTRDEL